VLSQFERDAPGVIAHLGHLERRGNDGVRAGPRLERHRRLVAHAHARDGPLDRAIVGDARVLRAAHDEGDFLRVRARRHVEVVLEACVVSGVRRIDARPQAAVGDLRVALEPRRPVLAQADEEVIGDAGILDALRHDGTGAGELVTQRLHACATRPHLDRALRIHHRLARGDVDEALRLSRARELDKPVAVARERLRDDPVAASAGEESEATSAVSAILEEIFMGATGISRSPRCRN
jgi:hypothetical protein